MPALQEDQLWIPVIARALCRISLAMAQMDEKSISEKASFLSNLGLNKAEIALMVDSSPASVAELMRQRAKRGAIREQASKASSKKPLTKKGMRKNNSS